MLVPGSASQSLTAALAAALDEELAAVERTRFADGEFKARVPELSGRAVVVASTVSASAHVEVLQLQDAAREAGASEVVTVLPYMGYARQDRSFRAGEPISARAVARAVSTGTDRVLTVNPHEDGVLDFFDVPATAVDAAPRLAEPLPDLADPLFLAPDEGAVALVARVRDAYGDGDVGHFSKKRDRETGEIALSATDVDAAGRPVVLVDDIVATGGTMSEAVARVADDAASVRVACVHPMLAADARTRLARAGVDRVVGTDTIEREVSAVSVAPAIATHL